VPLHPRHHRARGFNQAALLARTLAARLGLVFDDSVLHRHRVTGSQRGLDAARRAANVAGAFAARAPPEGGFQAVVLLVDDVVASGATVSECARALKRAGWDRVEAWCLARSV
jgi:ComF family protein